MKTLLFHKTSNNYQFKGFGNLNDAIDRCGEDIRYDEEAEKYFNEYDHCVAYADDMVLDLDGDSDTWFVVNADDLDYKQAKLVAAEGIAVEGCGDNWSLVECNCYGEHRPEFIEVM